MAHDEAPYPSSDQEDVYSFVKKSGRFMATQRTDGISTSDILTRILKERDQYLARNLQRGVKAEELNISPDLVSFYLNQVSRIGFHI